jgi:MSHA biogenesis protein MshO
MKSTARYSGFTLIEAVVVIAVTGVLAAMVAVFIRAPVESYFDLERRTQLTDTADTAMRRISRDLHRALPNSIRVVTNATGVFLEFLPTSGGGRYRAEGTGTGNPCGGAGDSLNFSAADTCFEVLGPAVAVNSGDFLVVYNLGQCSSAGCADLTCVTPGADAYQGCNRRTITGGGGIVTFGGAVLPFDSPGRRFQVISGTEGAVTYACENLGTASGTGTGTLRRYWNYGINALQNTTTSGFATSALLAQNVSACVFTYQTGVTERSGLVSLSFSITQNNEAVSLYQEVHVSNVP